MTCHLTSLAPSLARTASAGIFCSRPGVKANWTRLGLFGCDWAGSGSGCGLGWTTPISTSSRRARFLLRFRFLRNENEAPPSSLSDAASLANVPSRSLILVVLSSLALVFERSKILSIFWGLWRELWGSSSEELSEDES